MDLESQISQMAEPQEFVSLCNTVFTSKYQNDFQVIDGSRADQGNDGYVISEKRILAIYCPIKPEQRTDKHYWGKIASDLRKANALKDSGGYEIDNWTFVTPRKLSNEVIGEMREFGAKIGIKANHVDATFLAVELLNNPSLIRGFPRLYLPEIDEKLTEIMDFIKQSGALFGNSDLSDLTKDRIYKPSETKSEELSRVIAIRNEIPSQELKSELRTFFYQSTDRIVQLNALIGVLDCFDPIDDDIEDLITMCDQGVRLGRNQLADRSIEAYFLGHKGSLLSYKFTDLSAQTSARTAMANAVGVQLISDKELENINDNLVRLHHEFSEAFSEALEITKLCESTQVLADILAFIGNSAGLRYMHENAWSHTERASAEKRICKTALLMAKDIYMRLGFEEGVTNVIMNLANQIRFQGEEQEALQLVKQVVVRAQSYGDEILLAKATALQETLETGIIPDHLAGEKRKFAK